MLQLTPQEGTVTANRQDGKHSVRVSFIYCHESVKNICFYESIRNFDLHCRSNVFTVDPTWLY